MPVHFLIWVELPLEDNVLIGPKVNLITENHPLDPADRKHLFANRYILNAMHGLVRQQQYCLV